MNRDVFLSYNRADSVAVELIARRLREEAGVEPFLDRWHLVPGEPWQEALEQAIEASSTCAVCVGAGGIGPWQHEQMRAALDRAVRSRDDVRIIPVLLPGADPAMLPTFLSRRVQVDFRSGLDNTDAFEHLVAGVLGRPPKAPASFTLPDEPAPYPGLPAFTVQQSHLFFGRADECERLRQHVRKSGFVAVVGASGYGKSSLVQAGLLPFLDPGWYAISLTPGARPLQNLAAQLATLGSPEGRLALADDLAHHMETRPDGVCTGVNVLLASQPEISTLLIIVDQFEELFTQPVGSPEQVRQQQRQFLTNLLDAARTSQGRIRVLITLRADFVAYCLEFPELRTILEAHQMLLGPMGLDGLREAVTKPAQVIGVYFEHGLVGRLIDAMRNQPSSLPLLQFALSRLWDKRQGVWLTHAAYESIGGIRGALNQLADAIYEQLDVSQRRLARSVLTRLVTVVDETGYTRRRVHRDELDLVGVKPQAVADLIQLLSQRSARLLTTDEDTVELAHEALIDHWSALREWLDQNRAGLQIHRRLTDTALEWERHRRDSSYLYRGLVLATAVTWEAERSVDLNQSEQEFLHCSIARARQLRHWRNAAGIMAALIVAALLITMFLEKGPFAPRMDWTSVAGTKGTDVIFVRAWKPATFYTVTSTDDKRLYGERRNSAGVVEATFDLPGQSLLDMAPDPTDQHRIYVAVDTGPYRTDDEGQHWISIQNDLPLEYVTALAVSRQGAVYAGMYRGERGAYVSANQGHDWQPLTRSPNEGVIRMQWLDDKLLIATIHGLWRWAEGGPVEQVMSDFPIAAFLYLKDGLVAGGSQGLYFISDSSLSTKLSPLRITDIVLVGGDQPLAVARTVNQRLIAWYPGESTTHDLRVGVAVEGNIEAIAVCPGTTREIWVATDQGVWRGDLRRWFE